MKGWGSLGGYDWGWFVSASGLVQAAVCECVAACHGAGSGVWPQTTLKFPKPLLQTACKTLQRKAAIAMLRACGRKGLWKPSVCRWLLTDMLKVIVSLGMGAVNGSEAPM